MKTIITNWGSIKAGDKVKIGDEIQTIEYANYIRTEEPTTYDFRYKAVGKFGCIVSRYTKVEKVVE